MQNHALALTSRILRLVAVLLTLTLAAMPAWGLSMERSSLKSLTEDNSTILMGTVVDKQSYWNDEGTWIVTDVMVAPQDVIKGSLKGGMLTVTVFGGTVGETTVGMPGAPTLRRGHSYVLFVKEGRLPGTPEVQVLEGFTQNVFDVVPDKRGPRVISQASGVALYPDDEGKTEAVGGSTGMSFEYFKNAIQALMAETSE